MRGDCYSMKYGHVCAWRIFQNDRDVRYYLKTSIPIAICKSTLPTAALSSGLSAGSDIVIQSPAMRAKNPRKYKRYLTEPQEFPTENYAKLTNLTLKELKLQVGGMEVLNDIPLPSHLPRAERQQARFVPLQARIQNKRNALKKLPELTNAPHFINGKEQSCLAQHPSLFKASNPLFVVNTLFEIMKEDIAIPDAVPNRELKERKAEPNTAQKKKLCNEFDDPSAKSVKVHRPPRILDNQLTRLAQHSTFSRRKICSEEKSRPKVEKEIELLTFYKPKEKPQKKCQENEFL